MAHAHVLPAFPGHWTGERPSPARITAFSGVIALHVAAFALLKLPMQSNAPMPKPEEVIILHDVFERPLPPPPPPPPEQPPRNVPRTTTHTVAPTPPQPPIVIAEGPDVAPPPGPVIDDVVPPAIVEPGPVAVERLDYASAPPPPYPAEAARRRFEGTVVLRVLVDVDGTPLEVLVQESSGHRALDDAARKFVLARWRFRPAMQGDVAVQAVGIVPIKFSMR